MYPAPAPCERSNTKVSKFDGNNTDCCSNKGVALAGGGGTLNNVETLVLHKTKPTKKGGRGCLCPQKPPLPTTLFEVVNRRDLHKRPQQQTNNRIIRNGKRNYQHNHKKETNTNAMAEKQAKATRTPAAIGAAVSNELQQVHCQSQGGLYHNTASALSQFVVACRMQPKGVPNPSKMALGSGPQTQLHACSLKAGNSRISFHWS